MLVAHRVSDVANKECSTGKAIPHTVNKRECEMRATAHLATVTVDRRRRGGIQIVCSLPRHPRQARAHLRLRVSPSVVQVRRHVVMQSPSLVTEARRGSCSTGRRSIPHAGH